MTINQEIVATVQLSVDGKGFKRVGNAHAPWASTAEFLTAQPTTRRHEGMFGYIKIDSSIEIWHFVGGIADENFVKYSIAAVTSIVTEASNDDFPVVGDDDKIYINTTTKTPYIWTGSDYAVIGNPGPAGAKGSTGDPGPANSLEIGTVESGDTASATITGTAPNQTLNLVLPKGDAGADGVSDLTLRTNGTDNAVQDVLDLIDSDTVGVSYEGTGQVKLYTLSPVLFNGKAGTSEAIAAGIVVGETTYQNDKLAGRESEVFRSGALISDFDQGGGVEYAIKDTDGTLDSDTITFLTAIQNGEWIKIKLV